MGLFVERDTSEADLQAEVAEAMRDDPSDASDTAKVRKRTSAVKRAAAKKRIKFHWSRIWLGIAAATVLLGAGIYLAGAADSFAASEALKAATTNGYVAVTSSLKDVATSIIALGAAWSGALVGVLLNEAAD